MYIYIYRIICRHVYIYIYRFIDILFEMPKALCMASEEGFPQDFERAKSFLRTATGQRHPGAQGLLGNLVQNGNVGEMWEKRNRLKEIKDLCHPLCSSFAGGT